MTTTQTVKQYGEFAVTAAKPAVLAAIGAGDLAIERAKTVVAQFRSTAEALPGEATTTRRSGRSSRAASSTQSTSRFPSSG